MRAISMTWVILGHNFSFGSGQLMVKNKAFVFDVMNGHSNGLAIEAIKSGQFSVDTFFFIGSTLVSFLLLKDLDKTKGWGNMEGFIHMILFYVNRILRITIPYALVILFFIGIPPLIFKDSLGAGSQAIMEAEKCKEYAWAHLTYSHLFNPGDMDSTVNNCLGHTWFLSADMIFFVLSPLLIYPLWIASKSNKTLVKILAYSWWFFWVLASLVVTFAVVYESAGSQANQRPNRVEKYMVDHHLGPFNFSPFGYRNQCYLVGIMTGYLLHLYRNTEVKIDSRVNLVVWQVVAVVSASLVYGPFWIECLQCSKYVLYYGLHKELISYIKIKKKLNLMI